MLAIGVSVSVNVHIENGRMHQYCLLEEPGTECDLNEQG